MWQGCSTRRGLATLLIDLLTADEEAIDLRTAQLRFDIGLLAERLIGATDWLMQLPDTRHLRIGYFGASTGAAAALVAAAERPDVVGAVVSRGGRPDLAGPALPQVRAPTLLIVGGNDVLVIALNRAAARAAALREGTRDRAWCDAPVRGARRARRGGAARARLVRAPSYARGAISTVCGRRRGPMSATGLEVFDTTLHKTNSWLKELMGVLGWEDRHRAYLALRATLHALRDRLTVEEVAQLGAQLPMLVRGFYYEGWDPTGKPLQMRDKEQFLASIDSSSGAMTASIPSWSPAPSSPSWPNRITQGEIEDIKHVMPVEIRELWP